MNLKSPLNKICVFIISNFFISVSDAQTLVIPDSLKLYYSLINEAEMEILDSNLQHASKLYEEAFTYKKFPFCSDQYNKAICEALLNNYEKTHESLRYIVSYNYSIDSLKEIESLKNYFTSDYGKKLTSFDNNRTKFIKNTSHEFYDSLFIKDQEFRTELNYKRTEELKFRDSTDAYQLLNYINANGFPSEQEVGLFDNYHLNLGLYIVFSHNSIFMGSVNYHLNLNQKFLEILSQAFVHGYADIRVYQDLYQAHLGKQIYGTNYCNLLRIAMLDSMHVNNFDPKSLTPLSVFKLPGDEKIASINRERNAAGLPDLEDARKKLKYAYQVVNESETVWPFTFILEIHDFNQPNITFESEEMYNNYLNFIETLTIE